jgi:hypothetical protein
MEQKEKFERKVEDKEKLLGGREQKEETEYKSSDESGRDVTVKKEIKREVD